MRRVVRDGDLVRVQPHGRSAYVAGLLQHLERIGFAGAPRWVGRTEDGHDLLTWIDGSVPDEPPYDLDDDQLRAGADLVRRFHDAAAGSRWAEGMETVRHGDLGPHNTVFRDGQPVALIDWDYDVGPGRRAADFADAVWGFTELTSVAVPVAEQARRVRLMCTAYPGMTPAMVVDELAAEFERARHNHLVAGRPGPRAVFEQLLGWMAHHGSEIADE